MLSLFMPALMFKILVPIFFKFLKEIITAVTLSRLLRERLFRIMFSIHSPVSWCENDLLFLMVSQTTFRTSLFSSLSYIPSQPRTMKSRESSIMNSLMSGSGTIIPFMPPKTASLASASPIVRETERRPGWTLKGPIKTYSQSSGKSRGSLGNSPIFIHSGFCSLY